MKSAKKAGLLLALSAALALSAVPAMAGDKGADGQDTAKADVVSLANPFTDCAAMADAETVAGFSLTAPESLFTDYTDLTYRAIEDEMIEVIYRNKTEGPGVAPEEIRIRKAVGGGDISGDYTEYSYVEQVPVWDVTLTLKGSQQDMANVAVWEENGYAYSITSSKAVDRYVMAKLLQMIE